MFSRLNIVIASSLVVISASATSIPSVIAKHKQAMHDKAISSLSPEAKVEIAKVKANNEAKQDYSNVVVYFTSQSTRANSQIGLTKEVSELNKQGLDVKVAPIVFGYDDGLIEHARELHAEINNVSKYEIENVKFATRSLRINSSMFDDFNISKVPAILTASCKGSRINKENCDFYYKAVGETSLSNMATLLKTDIKNLFKKGSNL